MFNQMTRLMMRSKLFQGAERAEKNQMLPFVKALIITAAQVRSQRR